MYGERVGGPYPIPTEEGLLPSHGGLSSGHPRHYICILPQWPTHQRNHVFEDVLQAGHGVFFQGDAAHGFWGVRITPGDEYKAAFVTLNCSLFSERMPHALGGAPQTFLWGIEKNKSHLADSKLQDC